MTGLFVTGTDTDVGKTYVSSRVVAQLYQQTQGKVSARKPIASGCALSCEDARLLALASQEAENLVCPYQFLPAVSPARAIQQAARQINIEDCYRACNNSNHFTVIEGAGGWYSPLCSNGDNADFAKRLNLPVLCVVGNKLGCINHAKLTLAAIQQAGLTCIAVVVNDLTAQADADNINDLAAICSQPVYHLSYQAADVPAELIEKILSLYPTR